MAYHAESPTFQRDAIASLVLLSQNLLEWSGLPAVWRRSRSGRKPAVWGASLGVALFIWSCDIQPQQLLIVPALSCLISLAYILWKARG